MTAERREEVLVVALAVSIAVHVGVMLLVSPQVMTRATVVARSSERQAPMRVTSRAERPDPVKIEEILDLDAVRDAPAVRQDATVPRAEDPASAVAETRLPAKAPDLKDPPVAPPSPVFDVKPIGLVEGSPVTVPMSRIETPPPRGLAPAPDFSSRAASALPHASPTIAAIGTDPGSVFLPTTAEPKAPLTTMTAKAGDETERAVFEPAKEVFDKVDERVVAEEKAAVRRLVDSSRAADLGASVTVSMTAATAGAWRYFRVTVAPRPDLATVPKDVVLVIDGSGSIGNDRLSSCRAAARRILRSCTNSGDRFNLVVFRNAFSYAFRSWRECDAESFAAGDKWLLRQTAHGRTDVFSTIRSVLTLPRDPSRPLIALVVTDGEANAGVSDTADILARFTALNDGLVSVYMYGVKSAANRALIDVLTRGNRGESFIFEGMRWNAGAGLEKLSERFRDPVLSDLRLIFASGIETTPYPRVLRNLYRGQTATFVGRVPAGTEALSFSLRGLNGREAYEGFFRLPFDEAAVDRSLVGDWQEESTIDARLGPRH